LKLFCDDCLNILPTLETESIDAIITDPPYGINFLSTRTNHHKRIVNDDVDIGLFFSKWLPEAKRVLKPTGVLVTFCGGGSKINSLGKSLLEIEKHFNLIQVLVWSKGKTDGSYVGLGWRYRPSYENIIIASKSKDDYAFYSKPLSNVIVGKPYIPQKGDHPTQKPLWLMEKLVRIHTREGDMVLDPFMGSGTTGLACLRLNREFIGIEIDKEFFELAKKRLNIWLNQKRLMEF